MRWKTGPRLSHCYQIFIGTEGGGWRFLSDSLNERVNPLPPSVFCAPRVFVLKTKRIVVVHCERGHSPTDFCLFSLQLIILAASWCAALEEESSTAFPVTSDSGSNGKDTDDITYSAHHRYLPPTEFIPFAPRSCRRRWNETTFMTNGSCDWLLCVTAAPFGSEC